MRREWIEISIVAPSVFCFPMSPSMRREWIEIPRVGTLFSGRMSPSMRREWIEIPMLVIVFGIVTVSLHAEGVD